MNSITTPAQNARYNCRYCCWNWTSAETHPSSQTFPVMPSLSYQTSAIVIYFSRKTAQARSDVPNISVVSPWSASHSIWCRRIMRKIPAVYSRRDHYRLTYALRYLLVCPIDISHLFDSSANHGVALWAVPKCDWHAGNAARLRTGCSLSEEEHPCWSRPKKWC